MEIGGLRGEGVLTTGTATSTAAASGTQRRVFCGFCRDADDSGRFQNPPVKCFENGIVVATCAQPFESCEQANNGAFGPGGGGASSVILTGTPPVGDLTDGVPHPGTLVSLFCIPPSFHPTVDNTGDLPGPGAIALSGNFQLLR
jgi:hypothetical protein